ncbi:MAG: alpha/beta hydrolase [Pseudomonadota bacterium]
METENLPLNGHPFFVRRWGDPALPRLLLLHGFPEYGGAWSDFAPLLADRFHVIAPDQRGYGQSWAPDDVGEYVLSKLVDDMATLIGAGPVTVMGHDWGASVAYGLAMFRPDLVDRLIIANGVHPVPFQRAMASGGPQSEASQYINKLRAEGCEDRLAEDNCSRLMQMFSSRMDMTWMTPEREAAYKTEWARPGRLRGMLNWYRASPLVVADPGKPVEMPDLPTERLMVNCPHLPIWGAKDTALLPASTDGLETFAPRLTRVVLDDADHWLVHQQPEAIADKIVAWMRQETDFPQN